MSPKRPSALKKPAMPKKKDKFKIKEERKNAYSSVKGLMWISYKNFKKAHGMVTW